MLDLVCLCGGLYWLLAFAILFCVVYQYSLRTWFYFSDRNVQCVRGVPLLGSIYPTMLGFESAATALQKCYDLYPGEKIVGIFESLGVPAFLIRDPELVRRILVTDNDKFVNVDLYRSTNSQSAAQLFDQFIDSGRLTSVIESTKQFTSSLNDYVVGTRMYNTKNFVSRYACDVIAVNAFGIELNSVKDSANDFYRAAVELTRLSFCENVKIFLRRRFPVFRVKTTAETNVNALQRIVLDEIARRKEKQDTKRNDLIGLLLEGQLSRQDENSMR